MTCTSMNCLFQGLCKSYNNSVDRSQGCEIQDRLMDAAARMAERRRLEEQPKEDYTKLRKGSAIWYVNLSSGMAEKGIITDVKFREGAVETFTVDFAGESYKYSGRLLGRLFFRTEAAAHAQINNGGAAIRR